MEKRDLPIFELEQRLLETLMTEKRLVLTAPTGSGKSTQVPQMLLDGGLLGDGQVAVLQPRRLPTRMLAAWVAQARGVKLGGEVGYQMRLDNITSNATRICYLTEGVLLRRMLADPELNGVSAVVFDEFHERHLYGDISLARALQVQASTRPDLIVIVMSATLDIAAVQNYLHPCASLSSQGRTYPVSIEYLSKPAGTVPVWDLARQRAPTSGTRASARRCSYLYARRVRDHPHRAGGTQYARPSVRGFPAARRFAAGRTGRGGGAL